ncbi:MAG: cysteine--tRNA ligase [Chloroflexota bacterium]
MALSIFNVLGREKQTFTPITDGYVGIYVCGPTIYDHSHLGHAKTYVNFDMVVRWLRQSHNVLYVQNLTDVGHLLETDEDRMTRKARLEGVQPMQVAETYGRSYQDDMRSLLVQPPDIQPRAAGHVPEQIEMTQELIEKGFAYESNGSVYFSVTADADYGKLSNRRIDEQEENTRETVGMNEKRHPADFALWKRADPEHIMRWNSPWGEGFPGWHIECSAMARKYLGPNFDIHGGGIDNIFPHNECEIAQSESANDEPFANYWMLVGSLTVDGVKMSKSLGNFLTIKDALKDYRAEVIRTFILTAHYSNPVDFSESALDAAKAGWDRINNAVTLTRRQMNHVPESDNGNSFLERLETATQNFTAALNDDFNAPQSIAVLQSLTRDVNTLLNDDTEVGLSTLNAINDFYNTYGGIVLGIVPSTSEIGGANAEREAGLIDMLIEMRAEARARKDYARSDAIRDQLAGLGVQLDDRPEGTIWRLL